MSVSLATDSSAVQPDQDEHIFTVTELNDATRDVLERRYGHIWVQGEISNLACPMSGHRYFTLKDSGAQIRCALFRHSQRQETALENGDKVILLAKVSLYAPRGDYQLIVSYVQPTGLGQLQAAFEALKKQLDERGWFDAAHKKPIPTLPRRIAVITSASGAALQDIKSVVQKRFPMMSLVVYASLVQGDQAPGQLISAIERANADMDCDVILLTRGGGSLEDLWCFNDASLAGAIFASEIPVVSAVGHEIDFTIADFVADKRAPTPSAGAELLTPDQHDILAVIEQYRVRLLQAMEQRLAQLSERVMQLRARLRHPSQILETYGQMLDRQLLRLVDLIQGHLGSRAADLAQLSLRLSHRSPVGQLEAYAAQVDQLAQRLVPSIANILTQYREKLGYLVTRLDNANPSKRLAQGFSILKDAQGKVISQVRGVASGDTVHAQLSDGLVSAVVTGVEAS